MKAVVVGGGEWGTVFSRLLADRGHEVVLACRTAAQADAIAADGRNPRHLPEVDLRDVRACPLDGAPLGEADVVAVAVPSAGFAGVVQRLAAADGGAILILTKGLDPGTGDRLSTLVESRPVAVLSGPNFAEEIAAGLPAAAVVASEDAGLAERLQEALNSLVFRVYVNGDLAGVELCAAAKNVIALAAGGVDGLGLGDNAKAALITRGLAEMGRLAEAYAARPETFAGLAGMGDLIATCWSRHGRNRRAGELLARGVSPADAVAELGTVEGVTTAPVLLDLARRRGVELPITESVCRVLAGDHPGELLSSLMARRPTAE